MYLIPTWYPPDTHLIPTWYPSIPPPCLSFNGMKKWTRCYETLFLIPILIHLKLIQFNSLMMNWWTLGKVLYPAIESRLVWWLDYSYYNLILRGNYFFFSLIFFNFFNWINFGILQCLMGGWLNHYNYNCQPVDYSDDAIAMRVSVLRQTPESTFNLNHLTWIFSMKKKAKKKKKKSLEFFSFQSQILQKMNDDFKLIVI